MRIERLEPSRRKKDRFLAVLSDGSILRLTERELLDFSLRAGDELTEEMLERLRAAASRSDTRADAAALVGRRAMSRSDLTKKLRDKGATDREADYAAEWLEAIGALDDAAYAALLVRHSAAMGYGPLRWREELRRHGVERALWDAAMEQAPETDVILASVLQSRWKGRAPDEKELRRAADALQRRGFAWPDVRRALLRYTDEPGEE